ncbi:helix-turn-helix domain-containing protein [Paenibacillus sp. OVF10]|nr:helix-turn-helix domain-containing protein [Paenibacillus sp. OVF10]
MEQRLLAAGKALTAHHHANPDPMSEIARYMDAHYQEDLSLQQIAARFYLSREYISRKFKQQFGLNWSEYLGKLRINNAKLLLQNPSLRVAKISEMVGFQDEKYFSKVFKKWRASRQRNIVKHYWRLERNEYLIRIKKSTPGMANRKYSFYYFYRNSLYHGDLLNLNFLR